MSLVENQLQFASPAFRLGSPSILKLGGSFFSETEALVARFTTPPTALRKQQINALIGSLKTAGVWTKLDALYVTAAADSQAARRNWIADQYNLTAGASPTFTADRGYTGDAATSYLDTGLLPSAAVKYTLNSASLGAFILNARTAGNSSNNAAGAGSSTSAVAITAFSATSTQAILGPNSSSAMGAASPNASGLHVANRSGANDVKGYRNGAEHSTSSSNAAVAVSSAGKFTFLARNTTGATYLNFTGDQMAAGFMGESLSAQNQADIYTALSTYLTAVGAL